MSAAVFPMPAPLPDNRRLWLTLAISSALHLSILLFLGFAFPEVSRTMRDKALDIILVNAKSAKKPTNAQALGQSHLDGGGNTDEDRRVKTPLPSTSHETNGDEIEQAQRRVKQIEALQQQLLTEAKSIRSTATNRSGQDQVPPAAVSGFDLAESAKAMARLEGEINKKVDEYNKRPRKKNVSPRTTEYLFAPYISSWTEKIERIGTLNYPEAARGKLYGSLLVSVTINADGSIAQIVIDRPSPHKLLNDAARRIVQMAAPFAEFPPQIRKNYDQLEITVYWSFVHGDSIEAKAR